IRGFHVTGVQTCALPISGTVASEPVVQLETEAAAAGRGDGRRPGGPCPGAGSGAAARRTGARHPKKSVEHFRPRRVRDVYAGIDQLVITEGFQASKVCDLLEVSRSGFYTWRGAQESRREVRDRELIPWISAVFWRHRRRYGARRIAVELGREGIACGVARVARLLKTQGFRAIQPKSYKPRTTESRHRLGYNQNLLAGRAAPTRSNEVWVGDITYIPITARKGTGRFGYLALLMDLWSR